MGCCLRSSESTREIILIDQNCNDDGKSISRSRDIKVKASIQSNIKQIKSPIIRTIPINKMAKVKLSLKSFEEHPYLRKYSMMNTKALHVRHKTGSCLKPLIKVLIESNIKEKDEKDYQSDDEPLKKRASLRISKFMFVFQDNYLKKYDKSNPNKTHCNRNKRKPIKTFHSPYEDEYDLAMIHFKSPELISNERTS